MGNGSLEIVIATMRHQVPGVSDWPTSLIKL